MWHATVDGGWGGRHGLAGSRTAVALGAKDRERPGRLVRMRTAQAAARAQIPLPRDSDERPDTRDIANVIPDLRPVAGCVGGAAREWPGATTSTGVSGRSLLASIDLLTGEATPLASETHEGPTTPGSPGSRAADTPRAT